MTRLNLMLSFLLVLVLIIGGCSIGSVKESYVRSGPDITSLGEGYYEFEVWESEDGTIHLTPIEIPAPKLVDMPKVPSVKEVGNE